MNIAITGSSGILGSSFVSYFKKEKINFFTVNRKYYSLESSIDEVVKYFKSNDTSIIIHCAANTDVEFCEKNPEECFLDNLSLTEVLIEVSRKLNLKLVFISSTGVYGDHKLKPFIEDDLTKPTTIYHKSKLFAERMIEKRLKNYLIIRTGWLFGGTKNSRKNFVVNRFIEAKKSEGEIFSNINQKGNPTYTNDLVKNIFTLIDENMVGLFNCVNKGFASRFDYVNEIINLFKINVDVKKVDKSNFKRKANVSDNEMAINSRLVEINLNQMPSWKTSLKKYIESLKL